VPGFVGAELANWANESALRAASKNKSSIEYEDFAETRDKVQFGERRAIVLSEKMKWATAYHEAGHAIMALYLEHIDPLERVTIIPRTMSLGQTIVYQEADRYSVSRKYCLDNLTFGLGGRVGESIYTKDLSSSAGNDLKKATAIASKMVYEWGMSKIAGPVAYTQQQTMNFLDNVSALRKYSEKTQHQLDTEIKKLLSQAEARARKIINKHRPELHKLAKALFENESLEAEEIYRLLKIKKRRPSNAPI